MSTSTTNTFMVEFWSCLFIFPFFWPVMGFMAESGWPYYFSWLYHGFGLIFCDLFLVGSYLNPAMVISSYLTNGIQLNETFVRLLAELFVCFISFSLIKHYMGLPAYLGNSIYMSGPSLPPPYNYAEPLMPALCECILTCLLTISVQCAYKFVPSTRLMLRRVLTALCIRLLMIAGSRISTGNMNPLVALAWFVYDKHHNTQHSGDGHLRLNYLLIYVLAPIIGSMMGALFVNLIVKIYTVRPSSLPLPLPPASKNNRRRR